MMSKITTTWILDNNLSGKNAWDMRQQCESKGLTIKRINANHLYVSGTLEQHGSLAESIPGVQKILGLNESGPIAKPNFHVQQKTKEKLSSNSALSAKILSSFTPLQLASMYHFPAGDGTGQKVGIIELGGGYEMSDLTTYLANLGINVTPNITAVSVDGATNDPNDLSGASIEVVLDIEIILAIVPKAAIRVYFCPNSFQGFYDGILRAYQDGCKIVSISWGATESNWDNSVLTVYNNLFQTLANNNCTVFAAAGDNGSSDGSPGTNVDFPASSPYVVGCGGTRVVSDGVTIIQETVWNNNSFTSATGGGISKFFAKPDYQSSVNFVLNKRGVPDISGNADPNTGYLIYFQGDNIVVGGTSAVSPLWSGLFARINQIANVPGLIQTKIYMVPSVCIDVTSGNNGGYQASSGWDPCTGIGSPNGNSLQTLFQNNFVPLVATFTSNVVLGTNPLTVTFTDTSSGSPTSWLWNFGDSTTSTLRNPSHTYPNSGPYTISLKVTNTFAATNTLVKTNYINVTALVKPTPAFTCSPLTGKHPFNVKFNNTTVNGTSYLWNFGDSTTSIDKNPSHTYLRAGIYTVTLTATNSSGSKILTKTKYINSR